MTKKKRDDDIPQQDTVQRTAQQSRLALQKKVRIFYDLQRLRLQTGGRTKERSEESAIKLHEVDLAVLERREAELHQAERHALKDIEDHLKTIPFYRSVLSDKTRFRGIGPTMAGVILSEFDIEKEDTVSKMWSFAGLRPIPARRCSTCHQICTTAVPYKVGEYVNAKGETVDRFDYRAEPMAQHPKAQARRFGPKDQKDGDGPKIRQCPHVGKPYDQLTTYESGQQMRPMTGMKLPYNAWLRMKLVGVLAPVLLKLDSPWRQFYDQYKNRKQSAGWGRSDAHRHQAAMRYMIKQLLVEIHREWRQQEGLPVRPPYMEEYLGHQHGQGKHDNRTMNASQEQLDPDQQAEIDAEVELAK